MMPVFSNRTLKQCYVTNFLFFTEMIPAIISLPCRVAARTRSPLIHEEARPAYDLEFTNIRTRDN